MALLCFITHLFYLNPLSRFPQGGKALRAPSPGGRLGCGSKHPAGADL